MPSVMLSPHFSLQELCYSQTASRMGLSNTPNAVAYINLERLAGTLEKVRRLLGDKPMTITSGYRSEAVNAAVGGSPTSAHMTGLAVDFLCVEYGDPIDICKRLETNLEELEIDQLIFEYPPDGWVHIGLCPKTQEARHQTMTINENGTTTGFA